MPLLFFTIILINIILRDSHNYNGLFITYSFLARVNGVRFPFPISVVKIENYNPDNDSNNYRYFISCSNYTTIEFNLNSIGRILNRFLIYDIFECVCCLKVKYPWPYSLCIRRKIWYFFCSATRGLLLMSSGFAGDRLYIPYTRYKSLHGFCLA